MSKDNVPKFIVGQQVYVKPGIMDADFPDMPIGGWSGTVIEVDKRDNHCLIRLDKRTVGGIHPVYKKRCERDGLDFGEYWLGEGDLEPLTGDPPPIVQPTDIVNKPLTEDDQDDRVRIALGLTGDDPLPNVNEETLARYNAYLADHLAFPFEANVAPEHGASFRLTVVGLFDAEDYDEMCGIICQGRVGKREMDVPLADLEINEKTPNGRLIRDYGYWLWNHR